MILTEIDGSQAILLAGQRDRELMEKALQRALNTWDGAPADLIRVYDQLKLTQQEPA